MARTRMVTRTVEVNIVTAKAVDLSCDEVMILECTVTGHFADDSAILKEIRKQVEIGLLKVVSITSVTVKEVLYGMPEAEFIRHAEALESR